jgi:hypothetical protein
VVLGLEAGETGVVAVRKEDVPSTVLAEPAGEAITGEDRRPDTARVEVGAVGGRRRRECRSLAERPERVATTWGCCGPPR